MSTKPTLPPLPKPDSGLGVHVNTYSSDLMQARFNDPSAVDRHIAADMANVEARERARSA